jgi:hypothetical protein
MIDSALALDGLRKIYCLLNVHHLFEQVKFIQAKFHGHFQEFIFVFGEKTDFTGQLLRSIEVGHQ